MLSNEFFNRAADVVARDLVGKIIRRRYGVQWLTAAIVETEAYCADKASHSYLGRTPSREAMWAAPGTIYMYHSRGGPSLNFSVAGDGHAVLIKAARPWDTANSAAGLRIMHRLNPGKAAQRADHRLLSGQGLLSRALGLTVADWNGQTMQPMRFFVEDTGYRPASIVRCRRLGIPPGRDGHLLLRHVDAGFARSATENPLTKRHWVEGVDFEMISL